VQRYFSFVPENCLVVNISDIPILSTSVKVAESARDLSVIIVTHWWQRVTSVDISIKTRLSS